MKKKFRRLSLLIGIIMAILTVLVTGGVGNFLTTPSAGTEVQGHASGMEYALPLVLMVLVSEAVLLLFSLIYYLTHRKPKPSADETDMFAAERNPNSVFRSDAIPQRPQLGFGSVIGSFLVGNIGLLIIGPLLALLFALIFDL